MTGAYSQADNNAPMPAGDACDYGATLYSFFRPGEGKSFVDGTVRLAEAQPGVVVLVTASYGTY